MYCPYLFLRRLLLLFCCTRAFLFIDSTGSDIVSTSAVDVGRVRQVSLPYFNLQTPEEANYLKFHRCYDEHESFSGSFLITKPHLLNHFHNDKYYLSIARAELASFIVFDLFYPRSDVRSGTMIQSLDLLDFSVIHLSAYERLLRRYKLPDIVSSYTPVTEAMNMLKVNADRLIFGGRPSLTDKLNSTVVVMPWLGSRMGAGSSKLTFRRQFLRACFWSFYAVIPHIVIGVNNLPDYNFARWWSG